VDFAREDVDVAVRNTSEKQSGLEMIRLHDEELFPVCSPDLLKGKHPLNSPEDIVHHTLLHLDNRQDWFKWLERAGLKDWDTGRVDGPILNQVGMTIDAAVDGQGIALARTALVINDLTSGRLIRPFNLSLPVSYAYWLVYPKVSESLPKIQAFRDWVKNEVEEDKRFLAQMKGA
jgi:LysR family glycine cleavage system transcriptional activator